ncbi:MAG: hypothetical protein AAB364_02180 [Patescibacteria group bacterium]
MKNDLSLPVLWIAVGSLVLATVVMVNNYQPRVPTQPMTFDAADGNNNTAIVSVVRRDCLAIVKPLDNICERLYTNDPHALYCCQLWGQVVYASCVGSNPDTFVHYGEQAGCNF